MTKRTKRRLVVLAAALPALIPLWIAMYDTELPADASAKTAIVLGAAVYGDAPSPVFAARLDYARDLLRAGRIEDVLITGGVGKGAEHSEAEVGKRYLRAQGISADVILREVMSHTTFENLCHAKLILQPQEGETFLLISDPLHLPRALRIARDLGLEVVPAGTPHTRYRSLGTRLPFVLRESYFFARDLIGLRPECALPEGGVEMLTGWYVDEHEVATVDAETVHQQLERLVRIAGVERSPLEHARTGRAMGALRARAARAQFEELIGCVDDPRPVWPEYTAQIEGPTTLGDTCLRLITYEIDALYLVKGGLGVVSAANARAWWQARKGRTLPELQIETLATYRAQLAESRTADAAELARIDARLQRARSELAAGKTLTVER